jgi:hypothetical protein
MSESARRLLIYEIIVVFAVSLGANALRAARWPRLVAPVTRGRDEGRDGHTADYYRLSDPRHREAHRRP